MQETAATVPWPLVLGSRAHKWQSWNLTQNVFDSETNATGQVPLRIGKRHHEWGTLHTCVWLPIQHLQALSTLPSGCSLPHALRHGDAHISGAVCLGEGMPGKEVHLQDLEWGCLLWQKTLWSQVHRDESGSRWASLDPVDSSLMGRWVSEWEALKDGPREEPGLLGSKVILNPLQVLPCYKGPGHFTPRWWAFPMSQPASFT